MKLLSYKSSQAGYKGIGNWFIRFRLGGQYSHSEILFEPGDGVDMFMPDGTTTPDEDGAYWCCSSTGLERIPVWANRVSRRGHVGGLRFKRIKVDPAKWDVTDLTDFDPFYAANWARSNEGMLYDWQLISKFIAWFLPEKVNRVMCSEACASMLGIPDPFLYDPRVLHSAVAPRNR